MPEEALEHADAVVINGAEGVWPQVIEDAEQGHLRRIYHGADEDVFAPGRYVMPRFDLLRGRQYNASPYRHREAARATANSVGPACASYDASIKSPPESCWRKSRGAETRSESLL